MVFKACFKKEFLEEIRTKKFLRYSLFACGMVVLALFVFAMMSLVSKIDIEESNEMMGALKDLFELTYANYTMYFCTFMISYFTLIYIIMIMNSISKEISQNKWILPISAGILPENMIFAKLIVKTLSLVCAEILAMILHFTTLLIFFKSTGGYGVPNVLLAYLGLILFTVFMSVLTLSINAISKKGWVSALVSISLLIVGTTILENIVISGKQLITFTPFMFYEMAYNPSLTLNAMQWLISIFTYLIVIAGLVVWAIFSNKIKPTKNEDE